jgi:two-component system nitrogen regulation response regulator NtrX
MGKANILVVDDEINILNSLSGILADEGYAVSTAQNGDDALKILQEKDYDLVLLDIWLPGRRDGMQTLREIKRNNSGPEVVMISGHATIDTAVRATKMGAFDFLEKPVSLSGILETVEAALRHGNNLKKNDAPEKENFNFITGCPEMEAVKEKLVGAATVSKPILITGLPGSGKEFSARYLHSQSPRRKETFIKVACRRLTKASFDGLFGTSDQDPQKKGSLFTKLSGTVFLENPDLLEQNLQERAAKLINAGGPNIAFVAALTVSPNGATPVLGERLAAVFNEPPINLPPLGKRGAGITELLNSFLNDASGDFGKSGIRLSRRALAKMTSHPWVGNVKELKSAVENTVMACQSSQIEEEDISLG